MAHCCDPPCPTTPETVLEVPMGSHNLLESLLGGA